DVGGRQRVRGAANRDCRAGGEIRGDVVQYGMDVREEAPEIVVLVVGVGRRAPQAAIEQARGVVERRSGLGEIGRKSKPVGSRRTHSHLTSSLLKSGAGNRSQRLMLQATGAMPSSRPDKGPCITFPMICM